MKTQWVLAVLLSVPALGVVRAQDLTEDQQREIIQNYMYVTGQSDHPSAALSESYDVEHRPMKCGTPYILQFVQNYDKLDRRLLTELGATLDQLRPVTQYTYGTPEGHVLLHYDKTGTHACYQPNVDSDGDGVPDYIERLGGIADSCFDFEFDTLGYPIPEPDSGCQAGGDLRLDIYLQNLPSGYYGLTFPQVSCPNPISPCTAPAWIEIENDFQDIEAYVGNPIPAAQVTIAHEMFHTSHFAMNAAEHPAWFEMTAVWMEEQKYDDVNDYYLYDYVFFDNPGVSLADLHVTGHDYQSVIWPLYLSQKYGRDIIKAIWLRSAALGCSGPNGFHFLRACDEMIDSASQVPANAQYRCSCYSGDLTECTDSVIVPQNLATALNEFAVWNFFTGPFAKNAPGGNTYEEAANYSYIPTEKMAVQRIYPVLVKQIDNTFAPQTNAAMYLRLDNLDAIHSDTLLSLFLSRPRDTLNNRWAVAGIFQLRNLPDSFVVLRNTISPWTTASGRYVEDIIGQPVCSDSTNDCFGEPICSGGCPDPCGDTAGVINFSRFRTATFVVTPANVFDTMEVHTSHTDVGYQINNFSSINESRVDLANSVLTPYPNPAVLSQMEGQDLTFRFQTPTDSLGFAVLDAAFLSVDIYDIAGERVRTLEVDATPTQRGPNQISGIYEIGWDMKNDHGKQIASGVYLAVARLYKNSGRSDLLAEDRVKVAVIR